MQLPTPVLYLVGNSFWASVQQMLARWEIELRHICAFPPMSRQNVGHVKGMEENNFYYTVTENMFLLCFVNEIICIHLYE